MEKECTGSSEPNVLAASFLCRTAMEVMRDESNPPKRRVVVAVDLVVCSFTFTFRVHKARVLFSLAAA